MSATDHSDSVVIGGGLYGCWLALALRRRGLSVLLLEREPGLLRRASANNQARVHGGYHYPRSVLTARRSCVNAVTFARRFPDCIDAEVTSYYAIARRQSNITAAQFKTFCERIGAPLELARDRVSALFDPTTIEAVFRVEEALFDATRLGAALSAELDEAGVRVETGADARSMSRGDDPQARLLIRWNRGGEQRTTGARLAFNCTYAGTNDLLVRSGLPTVPLKHELAEMALVEVPEALRNVGITVMCGPFFSLLPLPGRGLSTLSHVRYTPHATWTDAQDAEAAFTAAERRTSFPWMQADARRYLPLAAELVQRGSLWELKALLPRSEDDDSRPILFRRDAGLLGLTCVLGGKIDNVHDTDGELETLLAEEAVAS